MANGLTNYENYLPSVIDEPVNIIRIRGWNVKILNNSEIILRQLGREGVCQSLDPGIHLKHVIVTLDATVRVRFTPLVPYG